MTVFLGSLSVLPFVTTNEAKANQMSSESEIKNEGDCPSCGPEVGLRQWKYIMIPVPQTPMVRISEQDMDFDKLEELVDSANSGDEEAKSALKKMRGDVDAVMALEPFPVEVCTECDHVFRNPVREGKNLWSDIDNLLLDLGYFMKKSDPDGELEREFVEGPYY